MNNERLNQKTDYHTSPDRRMIDNPNRTMEADKRLNALEYVIQKYQTEHSFVEGATVFGSTMHGAAHEKSDVDAMIFVDPAKLTHEAGVELDAQDYNDMAGSVQHDVLEALEIEQTSVSSGARNDIRILLINDEIIEDAITKYEQVDQAGVDRKQTIDDAYEEYWQQPPAATMLEDFDAYLQRTKGINRNDNVAYPRLGWEISGLFHPTVGEGGRLAELRNQVVDRMSQSNIGDKLWRDVVEHIDMFEGDMHVGTSDEKFPKVLSRAVDTFSHQ